MKKKLKTHKVKSFHKKGFRNRTETSNSLIIKKVFSLMLKTKIKTIFYKS